MMADEGWAVLRATVADAPEVLALTRAVFSTYAAVVPEPSSLREQLAEVESDLAGEGVLVVRAGSGALVAACRFGAGDDAGDGGLWLRRVCVAEPARGRGLGSLLLSAAEGVAVERGHDKVRVGVRLPLVQLQEFWVSRGFHRRTEHDYWVELERRVPTVVALPTVASTESFGRALAGVLRAGDVVVLTGELGAGKTALTRGIGAGLGVRGAVTSPTFVIARVHPSSVGGPGLVHVDAYRLGGSVEVDDLDLEASLADTVTVVEWGEGKVEGLASDRLHIEIERPRGGGGGEEGDDGDDGRTARLRPIGARWAGVTLPTG